MPPKRKATTGAAEGSKSKGKKAQKGPSADAAEAAIPMGRSLASTEKRTRDAAIRSLTAYLTDKAGDEVLPPLEIAKLWKGIFYCFWMSDKPLVQQALAAELAELLLAVPGTSKVPAPVIEGFDDSVGDITVRARSGLSLLEGFWDAMLREWSGLDKWRLNKFYLLIRKFVNASFRLLVREQWDTATVSHFSRLLVKPGGVLCANDPKVPDSMTYHFTDVFLDELQDVMLEDQRKKLLGHSEAKLKAESRRFYAVFQPVIDTAATCHSKTVYSKIMNNIFFPLAEELLMFAMVNAERDPYGLAQRKICQEEGISLEELERREEKEELAEDQVMALNAAIEEHQEVFQCESEYHAIASPSTIKAMELRRKLFKMLFQAASRSDALAPNRRKMYAVWQEEKDRREEEEEESDDEEDDDEVEADL